MLELCLLRAARVQHTPVFRDDFEFFVPQGRQVAPIR